MNIQVTLIGFIIAVSWALALSLDSLFSICIAALVLFSQSVPVCLLLLLSINLIAFIQASLGGKKTGTGHAQRRFGVVFFGVFCGLTGSALPHQSWSYALVFFGLLLTVSNSLSSFFFYSHFESLSLKASLQSVVIPSFVAMDILLKVRTEIKADNTQLWDIPLLLLGLSTFLIASVLALSKKRIRVMLLYLALSWIGALLFLLVIDAGPLSDLAYASCALMSVTTVVLLDLASRLGDRHFAFAKIISLGLPGGVGFAAIYFALKIAIGLNVVWLVVLGIGFAIQSITLLSAKALPAEASRNTRFRFWLLVLVQFCAGFTLFWMDNKGGFR